MKHKLDVRTQWTIEEGGRPAIVCRLVPGKLSKRCRDVLGKARKWSGVYVVVDPRSGRTIYVGESHTGRLAKTALRHFHAQSSFSERGEYVRRVPVDLYLSRTKAGDAMKAEGELIARLVPVANIVLGRMAEKREEAADGEDINLSAEEWSALRADLLVLGVDESVVNEIGEEYGETLAMARAIEEQEDSDVPF